jgi:hypothetical protein
VIHDGPRANNDFVACAELLSQFPDHGTRRRALAARNQRLDFPRSDPQRDPSFVPFQ